MKNFKESNFGYLAFPHKKIIIEFENIEEAYLYAKTFGGIVWNHYPYLEYGYDDPYTFTENWTLTNDKGEVIYYTQGENGIEEVIYDDPF